MGTYAGFERMTDLCKTRVTDEMRAQVDEAKGCDDKFAAFGVAWNTALCKTVWASNKVPSLHFYCLNQTASVFQILTNLGIPVNPLESAEDKAELLRIEALVKTFCPPPPPKAPPREEVAAGEESAQKKTKTV